MLIETKRMIVRDFDMNDAADLQDILGDDETMKNCEPPYTLEKTVGFLKTFCIEENGAVAAVHRESGRVIGYILFHETDEGVYEMGWFFNRNYWGNGYAFEACQAVLEYALEHLNAQKVFAETIDAVKSVSLMEKLGMKPEGIQRRHTKDSFGNWADLYVYSIPAEDGALSGFKRTSSDESEVGEKLKMKITIEELEAYLYEQYGRRG